MSTIPLGKRVVPAQAKKGVTYAFFFPRGQDTDTFTFTGEYVSHTVHDSTSATPLVDLTLRALSPGALAEIKKRKLEIVKEDGDLVTFVPPKFFLIHETASNAAPGGRRRKTRRRRRSTRRRVRVGTDVPLRRFLRKSK